MRPLPTPRRPSRVADGANSVSVSSQSAPLCPGRAPQSIGRVAHHPPWAVAGRSAPGTFVIRKRIVSVPRCVGCSRVRAADTVKSCHGHWDLPRILQENSPAGRHHLRPATASGSCCGRMLGGSPPAAEPGATTALVVAGIRWRPQVPLGHSRHEGRSSTSIDSMISYEGLDRGSSTAGEGKVTDRRIPGTTSRCTAWLNTAQRNNRAQRGQGATPIRWIRRQLSRPPFAETKHQEGHPCQLSSATIASARGER